MTTTPVKKIATVLGAGSLLVGAAIAAPAASAAPPVVAAVSAPLAGESSEATGARTALVNAWYEQFLGRTAIDDAGARYWVVRLRTEAPADVLADLLRTPEHVGAQIDGYYTAYLGRSIEGDPAADHWFAGVYAGTFPLEWVEQNVLGSAEYQTRVEAPAPEGAPQLAVTQWYRDVLGREAAPGEIEYWSIQLEDQSNLDVLRDIWFSPEAVGVRIASHYRDSLGRSPGAGEIAYWSGPEIASDVDTQIAIATSAEYRERAAAALR